MSPVPIPIPDGVAEAMGGSRIVLGDAGDPTGDVRPCEYVLTASPNYPGKPCVHALIELSADERERVADGARLWLTLDGMLAEYFDAYHARGHRDP